MGGGFTRAADCEKKIGVLHLRLATFERAISSADAVGVVAVTPPDEA